METHAHGQVHWQARQASLTTAEVLQAGALAAIAAGFIMAAWQMVVAAIAQNPTAVPGIHQTLWTPPEGIWSVVFGVHHLHGSFHLIPAVGGIVGNLGELADPRDRGRVAADRDPRSPAGPRRGGRTRGRVRRRRRGDPHQRHRQHAEDPDPLQLDASLELVGRPRDLSARRWACSPACCWRSKGRRAP
jgi:hypothetical protein